MSVAAAAPRLKLDVTRPMRVGLLVIAVGFVGFMLWAVLAPLTSAAIAPGIVVADSRNKSIQHLEGGIIHEVLAHEGERVTDGQVLARLDSASADANLGRLQAARYAVLAEQARLIAERDEADRIDFPKELLTANSDPDAAEAVKGQQVLFDSHRTTAGSEQGILAQRIAQSEEEIRGVQAQVASEDEQIKLIKLELADVRFLVRKELERKARLLALERNAAELGGRRGQHLAEIARAKQTVAEMQERQVNLKAQRLDQTAKDLREAQTKLADLTQQMRAASDTSRRLEVKAPVSGKIVSVFHETKGGVVKPGETIMELLPDQDQLVIEAQLRPEDIDSIAPDQTVRVRLTAYSQRHTPSLKGRVAALSPDRIIDQKGEKAHYMARITVDAAELVAHPHLALYPGMPAVAFIETGRVSLLDYLLTPLFGGIERSFREQ